MNNKENLRSLLSRKGFERISPTFDLCPHLNELFKTKYGNSADVKEVFNFSERHVTGGVLKDYNIDNFLKYYPNGVKEGTHIDQWGVAHEPGSKFAKHMTRMVHPLNNIDSVEQILEYPFPNFKEADYSIQNNETEKYNNQGYFTIGNMQCTIWESAWYMRGMENLMMDMLAEEAMAEVLLDKVTDIAITRAVNFAKSGVDMIFLGDDIGMQKTIMMSEDLYRTWLKPRIKMVIDAARRENPDVLIAYHSCGYVKPFIEDFIDVGIDVLNPVQPECMNFKEIHEEFGDRISFLGALGTQTTMPFGSTDDVRRVVFENLEIAGDNGGLWISPTHLLEPEVPWENIEAYVKACNDFK